MVKKFLVLGSCRVVNTIACNIGDNILVNQNDLWFTHYPQEHAQKVKHIFGVQRLPSEHTELLLRLEQQAHYKSFNDLHVAKSVQEGGSTLITGDASGTLNVVVELATLRFIRMQTDDGVLWGHTSSMGLIRKSKLEHEVARATDEQYIAELVEFERVVQKCVSQANVAESVNFVYVPHTPFIEHNEGGWIKAEPRAHIRTLIKQHCENPVPTGIMPVTRNSLDTESMIMEHGGIESMLKDQDHYTPHGRQTAFEHLSELTV